MSDQPRSRRPKSLFRGLLGGVASPRGMVEEPVVVAPQEPAQATLLVVDDEPSMLRLLTRTLETAGHRVLATGDPTEVLPLAESTHLDAIILDVVMPALSGWDLLSALRKNRRTRSIPVVLMTGLGTGEERPERADGFLAKPFLPHELVARVEALIGPQRADNEE